MTADQRSVHVMRVRVRVGSESTAVGEDGSVAIRPNDLEPKKEKRMTGVRCNGAASVGVEGEYED